MTHSGDDAYPRLCYLGSVNVEETSGGMMLLYRLLESYPPDRLLVIHIDEGDNYPSRPDRRIKNIPYHELRQNVGRGWFFSRMQLPRVFWMMQETQARLKAREAARVMAPFRPDAILTVHELFGWMTASKLATQLKVPLHLVMHDEWFRNIPMSPLLPPRFEALFGRIYRSSSSRLCISPYMEEEYGRRYGARGTVLYPMRGRAGATQQSPRAATGHSGARLKVAYGGNLYHKGYWGALREMASALEAIGGQLLIYGPDESKVKSNGLDRPNVTTHGFVYNMIERMRDEADVLFVPMTFDAWEKSNMQFSFPSKLAEYTGAGLPLLIYGPEYCSAVHWARQNGDCAEVVTVQGEAGVRAALKRLSVPERRLELGRRALELGERYFSFKAGEQIFQQAIQSGAGQSGTLGGSNAIQYQEVKSTSEVEEVSCRK
jgi:hypothetical protein